LDDASGLLCLDVGPEADGGYPSGSRFLPDRKIWLDDDFVYDTDWRNRSLSGRWRGSRLLTFEFRRRRLLRRLGGGTDFALIGLGVLIGKRYGKY
jgi:hypothetical protein